MFFSASQLEIGYGVDAEIARFYVDREPPPGNLYWEGKLLYLRPSPGYIFLPLIADLYYRQGISRPALLDEIYVTTLEAIGHYAAEQEAGYIDYKGAQARSSEWVRSRGGHQGFIDELDEYFRGTPGRLADMETPVKALHRGDIFLYSLSLIDIDQEKRYELVRTWFALITTLLLLDDAEDYQQDIESGDENAFVDTGDDPDAIIGLRRLISQNIEYISTISQTMARRLHEKIQQLAEKPFIKDFIKT